MAIEVCPIRRAEIIMDPMIGGQLDREDSCLRELRLMVKGDKNLEKLSSTILTDRFLLHFVRGRKCNPKRAFSTLQNYIAIRRLRYKEMFAKILPSKLPLRKHIIKKLQHTNKDQSSTGVFRVTDWNPEETSLEELIKIGLLYMEGAWDSEVTERKGFHFVIDTKGFSLNHAKQCTPALVQTLITLFWDAFPIKYHHIHILNAPVYFTMTFNVVKHFLPPKLRERLHFHGSDMPSFHKFYSPEVLPESLGGKLPGDEAYDLDFVHEILVKEGYYLNFSEKILKS